MSVAKRDLEDNRKVTTHRLIEMKQRGEKISMLTAYDYSMAQLIDQAGMDVILVGDSASNVMAGNVTTLPITLDQMIYHGKSVVKAVKRALVVVDLPFGTYQGNSKEALASAIRVMKETHADCIKLEGGSEIRESIERILCAGIPVMGHLGLTPQSINKFGTYTVRAREEAEAKKLIADAHLLEEIGCFAIVLEKIPAALAAQVASELTIPIIGIGAGGGVDGQVLVMHDMLGINQGFSPRFLRRYANLAEDITRAVQTYIEDVKTQDGTILIMCQSHLLIGAASSGSGKTTFTLGLLRALKNRSFKVQPFKCGPDYIDTRHHRMAAGNPSVNLDLFMMSEAHVRDLYVGYTEKADVAVTEGVMGLFDGYDGMKGSCAEIACMLKIPVVLIVNAKSTAYSVAPLLYGFKQFNKQVQIVGAVFNFVASENHYSFLKQACEDAGVEALGYLPKCADVEIPSRHLGLSLDEDFCFEEFADRVAELVEKHVNINRLLELTKPVATAVVPISAGRHIYKREPSFPIAVACDPAFNFVYEANIRYLHHLGEVTYFSPLADTSLPDAGFVYLPGGYPELYLAALSANRQMLQSIRRYVESGGKLLAECGGMMYLCDEIRDKNGDVYPMAGVLHQSATMENMKLRLGYRTLLYNETRLKGHEFHYSRLVEQQNPLPSCAVAYTAKGVETDTPLYHYKNVWAGYTHLYWADPVGNEWFTKFVIDGNT